MSIKEIAQMTGASASTVSRVLNNPNYKCSSKQMRDKIWKAAMELNYVPNEAARNLKLGTAVKKEKMYYISILMTRDDATRSNSFFNELLRVIESEIHRQNCILVKVFCIPVFSNDKKCRQENLDSIIRNMQHEQEQSVDGLIVIGKCSIVALKKLEKAYKNVVSVNRNSTNYEVDEVTCDGKKVAEMALEYLLSLGHKNIGYVGECRNEARYKGYTDVLHKHDIELIPDYVCETKQTEAEGYEAMKKMLEMGECPTAIYCANDITAIGMLKYLSKSKNHYYMPSIIGCDDIEEAQNTKPMLTTVRLPKEEMGKFAVYLLMDRIGGGHKSVVKMELEGKLMIRDSCTSVESSGWCDYYI